METKNVAKNVNVNIKNVNDKAAAAKTAKPKTAKPKIAPQDKLETAPANYDFFNCKRLARNRFATKKAYLMHSAAYFEFKSTECLAAASRESNVNVTVARAEKKLVKLVEKMELLKKTLLAAGVDPAVVMSQTK